jgi:hypothetical protein
MQVGHQNIVLCLEPQHEVKGSGDTQGHTAQKGALTQGVNQKRNGDHSDRSAVSHATSMALREPWVLSALRCSPDFSCPA